MTELPTPAESVSAVLATARETLTTAGVTDPAVDATLLLAHVLGASRGDIQLKETLSHTLSDADLAAYDAVIARRAAREPLQHITGTAPFRYLELLVGPGVFVPRPETEIVAQYAIDALWAVAAPEPIAVDLGTGSGAIALAMATEVPHARVVAVERSAAAHGWAAKNVTRVGATNLELRRGDFAHALDDLAGTVAVIASNPPYVPADAIPRDLEVRLHDPKEALYSGADGLDDIRIISGVGLRLGYPGSSIVLEHGEWQGAEIREILTADGWQSAATHQDLTMRDRVTTAVHP
ncbi:peptide chain release factor N(5)-glutamine methyltransferase [Microbacterium mitrae]|uniref:Release factor glutamine methyltransferase n=1 Tax=Microbacterium mitrae TaxID=664640 RepID=A0A5C8HLU8_9MICO|nr:peptide chain release factor N(5)-glutamine methyltransferase [Microbacterium mitrae]TXK04572.1 peptide chain release factor N(5)-glutamine methyltransferase [Microbacterium mitrae]